MASVLQTGNIFKLIFLFANWGILIQISLKFPMVQYANIGSGYGLAPNRYYDDIFVIIKVTS